MHQAPARIWNEIAETQTLATAWAEQMFPLDPEELEVALDREEARMAKVLGSRALAASYLVVMPLLWEREAIRMYKATKGVPIGSLPAVETVDEAVYVATQDYRMTQAQQQKLAKALQTRPE